VEHRPGGEPPVTFSSRERRARRRRPPPPDDDVELLDRLRAGDDHAFIELVSRHHDAMVRLASTYVPAAAAEEVVQDTWMVVVRGVDRFEGRSSLRTWLMRILVNRARSTWAKELRSSPLDDVERAVDPRRFDQSGAWAVPPVPWVEQVDDRVDAEAFASVMRTALLELPSLQRQVVSLRDVDGMTSREVCDVLDITEGNQRVLLHRGRSRLRQALETELGRV
jgi:RNA polymerase sigma-70 factor (ECF subfamily)